MSRPKIAPSAEIAEAVYGLAWVTRDVGHVDPEVVEILYFDRVAIANWLDSRGWPGAAKDLREELERVDK